MTTFEAILMGLVQGATEFLPVSSSGHLVLGGYLLDLTHSSLLFDIVLHVGTLVAVIWYYRDDIVTYAGQIFESLRRAIGRREPAALWSEDGGRLLILIIIASIPTALLGGCLDAWLEMGTDDRAAAIAVCIVLIVNGCILFGGRFVPEENAPLPDSDWHLWNITPVIALSIGIAQGLAVIPGLSRSGTTVITALALGVWRERAAKFSFLLSIPAILGALLLKFEPRILWTSGDSGLSLQAYGFGALAATLVGYICLVLLVRLIRNATFHHFSWYCWLLGGSGLTYIAVVQ